MTDKKTADRQRRYRVREQAKARAIFAGATEIEIAWFGLNSDGEHVAIDYSGQPIPLIVRTRQSAPPEPVETHLDEVSAKRAKKVYAPKSWPGDKWNEFVKAVQSKQMSIEAVLKSVDDAVWDDKQKTHVRGIVKAMPDTPDWYASLPLADL